MRAGEIGEAFADDRFPSPGITQPLPTVVVQPTILWEDVAYTS